MYHQVLALVEPSLFLVMMALLFVGAICSATVFFAAGRAGIHFRTCSRMVVVFGASGDLFKRKLVKAFWEKWLADRRHGIQPWKVVLCTGGKALSKLVPGTDGNPPAFRDYVTQQARIFGIKIPADGTVEYDYWLEFLNSFKYVEGRCSEKQGFVPIGMEIGQFVRDHLPAIDAQEQIEQPAIMLYFALPFQAYAPTLECLAGLRVENPHRTDSQESEPAEVSLADWNTRGNYMSLLFDKPLELSKKGIQRIEASLRALNVPWDQAKVVEHFLEKVGLAGLLQWLYRGRSRNELFRGSAIQEVSIEVCEEIGSEGREYPGVMIDSILNHVMFLVSVLLGNPLQNGWSKFATLINQNLDRLIFHPEPDRSPEENREAMRAFYRHLSPRGILGYCPAEDKGNPGGGSEQATAALIEFYPRTNRFGSDNPTLFRIIHVKWAPEKFMRVRIVIRNDYGKEEYVYNVDSWFGGSRASGAGGLRCYGPLEITPVVSLDGSEREAIKTDLRPVPEELADGYPSLIRRWLDRDDKRFPNLGFQGHTIDIVMPWAKTLEQAWKGGNVVTYQPGTHPFAGFDRGRLLDLRPQEAIY